jgi:hypothetical protein
MDAKQLRRDIAELEKELTAKKKWLQEEEEKCNHQWSDPPLYEPEPTVTHVFDHYEPHGSDPEPVYRTVPDQKDRWKRFCTKCGKVEYTYKQ